MNIKRIIKSISIVFFMMYVMYVDALVVYANNNEKNIPEGYTPIYNISELYAIRNNPKGNYILMNDIDMSVDTAEGGDWDQGNGWKPIENFGGIFDGNGNRIKGMHIYGSLDKAGGDINIGLFANTKGAVIKELGVVDCDIDICSQKRLNIGGIIGCANNETTLESCYTSGNIVLSEGGSNGRIGGLIGYSDIISDDYLFIKIENCFNYCKIDVSNVTEKQSVGGLIGGVYSNNYFYSYSTELTNIKNCYSYGKIIQNNNMTDIAIGALCGSYYYSTRQQQKVRLVDNYYSINDGIKAIGDLEDEDCIMVDKLTTAQMKIKQCYANYDFDSTWTIDPYCSYQYPQLQGNRIVRINSLKIKTLPSKVVYYQGDKLDLADSSIEIEYEDGIKTTIPISEDMLSGYNMIKIGNQTISVSYGGMKTSFDIEVKEILVNSISIPSKISIDRSKTKQLQAVILPENASDKTVTWKSEDDAIVTVDENGLIMAKAKGKTTITATSNNGLKSECEITVLVPAVAINLDNKEIQLKEGENIQVKAQVLPLESTDAISWKSSDENVAVVSDGIIVAKNQGIARITAFTESGVENTCEVTVLGNGTEKEITDSKSDMVYTVTESDEAIKTVEYKSCNINVQKVVIPKTVTINNIEYKVTAIANNAFKGCTKLKKVTIGSNVESIGDGAFFNCKELKQITIPSNVRRMGKNVFKGCNKLKTITIKTTKFKTKSVRNNAFKGVSNKVTIKVPKKMKKYYKELFRKKGLSKRVKIK